MADDDEREQPDSEEGASSVAPVKKVESKVPLSAEEQILGQLKQITTLLMEAREQQSRYLWILFPIGAILLVQTILQATRF